MTLLLRMSIALDISSKISREIKDKALRKAIMNVGYALTQPTFKYYCNEIHLSNPDAGRWINNIPIEK